MRRRRVANGSLDTVDWTRGTLMASRSVVVKLGTSSVTDGSGRIDVGAIAKGVESPRA